MNSKKQILLHVIGCMAFLALILALSPHPPNETGFLFQGPGQRDFISNIIMLIFFYVNFYLLIPKLYLTKKYPVYYLCVAGGLLMICLVPTLITNPSRFLAKHEYDTLNLPEHFHSPVPSGSSFLEEIRHSIYLFFAVTFFSLLLKVRTRLFQAETAKHNAELSYLKAQINPHFLFNTLNSIYSLALVKDDKTPDAVIQLSELMRYIIKDANNDMVSLGKEINYINNYIALQQSRLGNTVMINYKTEGNFSGKQIVPLILITYIENAFKHGVNPDENSEIIVSIRCDENNLYLFVYNNKVKAVNDEKGIGVRNTAERLKMLYPSKHFLKVIDKKDSYTIDLVITLA